MKKAFLSHSSKDKFIVEKIAEKLTMKKVHYDSFTFETGEKTFDEIKNGLEKTNLFVFFISDNSLDSKWVNEELNIAKEKYDLSTIKRILPIIIDPNIKYYDLRIPEWIRNTYNLRVLNNTGKISFIIDRALRELTWDNYPQLKEKKSIFVGRNETVQEFEEKFNNFDKVNTCFIVSGMDKIGRKAFLKNCLVKVQEIKEAYDPPKIDFVYNESIEDFILKINDLGFNEKTFNKGFLNKTQEEKIEILLKMVNEIQELRQPIFISDSGGIILSNGELVSWFKIFLDRITSENFIFGIASKFRLRRVHYKLSHIPLSELSPQDRKNLFFSLIRIDNSLDMDLVKKEFDWITKLFTGYPEQIIYAYEILKENGVKELENKSFLIENYNEDKILNVLKDYSDFEKNILILISKFEFISYSFLYEIIGENTNNRAVIDKILIEGLCSNIGSFKEYLALNDNVKDYLNRRNEKIKDEYNEKLKNKTNEFLNNLEENEDDYSIINHSLIEAVRLNTKEKFYENLLIPSHFLKTMAFVYKEKKDYNEVVTLGKRILEHRYEMDEHIEREIRYYLCLALARMKKKEFNEEVKKIKNKAYYYFLNGFYNRKNGKMLKALEFYKKALEEKNNYIQVKRELVLVYQSLGEFSIALDIAKDLFMRNKNNPHNIYAYFKCVIKQENKDINEIAKCLDVLENLEDRQSKEFFNRAKIEYHAYVENNIMAVSEIEKLIEKSPPSHYLYLEKFDIAEKFNDIVSMEKTLKEMKSHPELKKLIDIEDMTVNMEIVLAAKKGQKDLVEYKLNNLSPEYPESLRQKLHERILNILNRKKNNGKENKF